MQAEMKVPFDKNTAPALENSRDDEAGARSQNCPCLNALHNSSKAGSQPQPSITDDAKPSERKCYDLPTIVLKDNIPQLLDDSDDTKIKDFLTEDLNLDRLDKIHDCLWIAGRPQAARPLHRQIMMDRKILITEQFDLHLVWRGSQIFLKPLPAYLLNYSFWEKFILCQESDIDRQSKVKVLHGRACGLLLSYMWLIRSKNDMEIAREKGLIPKIYWKDWRSFTRSFLDNIDPKTLKGVDRRFHHGELRAGRLNIIYRAHPRVLNLTNFFRGYISGYNRYSVFFFENFAWPITIFAYVSVLLSAMQVGLRLEELQTDIRFQRASYGFALLSIFIAVITAGLAFVLFGVLFCFNWIATTKAQDRAWINRHETRPTGYLSW